MRMLLSITEFYFLDADTCRVLHKIILSFVLQHKKKQASTCSYSRNVIEEFILTEHLSFVFAGENYNQTEFKKR